MHESDTYQAVLDEGGAIALRRVLLRQGATRFGPPPEKVILALEEIRDLDRLMRLAKRIREVSSWQELLDTP